MLNCQLIFTCFFLVPLKYSMVWLKSYTWMMFSGLHLYCNSVIWKQCKICFGNESKKYIQAVQVYEFSCGWSWLLCCWFWFMCGNKSLPTEETMRGSLRSLVIERTTERKKIINQKWVETTFALRKISCTGCS